MVDLTPLGACHKAKKQLKTDDTIKCKMSIPQRWCLRPWDWAQQSMCMSCDLVLLTDLRDKKCTHARASSSTKGAGDLET